MVALGWVLLSRYLPRWTSDWRLQFFALFAFLTSSPPMSRPSSTAICSPTQPL